MKNVIEGRLAVPHEAATNENTAFLLRIRVRISLCFKLRPRTEEKRRSPDVAFWWSGLNSKLNQHAEGGREKKKKRKEETQ